MKTLISVALVSLALISGNAVLAEPVMVGSHNDYCEGGAKVRGLKKTGDGFLAVRTGPRSSAKRIDKIYNGQWLIVCGYKNGWYSVIYTKKNTDCKIPSSGPSRKYKGRCWSGWVHGNWVRMIAG